MLLWRVTVYLLSNASIPDEVQDNCQANRNVYLNRTSTDSARSLSYHDSWTL